jgi:hypothetical protein
VHSAGAGVERRLPVWCGVARLAIVAAVVLMWTAPCLATTVVPMSEADLASEAAAVVLGRVTNLSSHLDAAHGQIFTDVTLGVDEVVAGPALPATVTLRQPGGQVGNVRTWIDGSPEFSIGERVLVYLKVARDGTLRVLQLYQGKLSVMVNPLTGDEVAIRITGGGVRVLAPLRHGATSPPKDTHRLDDLRRAIRAARGRSSVQTAPPMQTAPAAAADVVQQQEAFVFLGTPSRWFEPDSGAAITVAINSSGQPQAPTEGFDQIRQGLAAWSNDPQANFRYADGGFTSAAGLRFDGVNAVSFNDPDGAMDTPVNCSGTLAMGGFSRSTTESRVVNGTTFMRILDGDVVFNDGWQGCGFYETFGNFAEVATHELGHVLGLGHSTDPTATMFAAAHFDGRGASLKADDLAGLRFIYPATTSQAAGPTLTFSAPANGATVSGTTTVSLAVTGGAPPYAYQVSLDGAAISTSASFSWNTPAVSNGTHTLSATVTDAAGHAASASITVTVANAGGGSAGVLRVAITQPASGATVSGVPWAVMWLEGSERGLQHVHADARRPDDGHDDDVEPRARLDAIRHAGRRQWPAATDRHRARRRRQQRYHDGQRDREQRRRRRASAASAAGATLTAPADGHAQRVHHQPHERRERERHELGHALAERRVRHLEHVYADRRLSDRGDDVVVEHRAGVDPVEYRERPRRRADTHGERA